MKDNFKASMIIIFVITILDIIVMSLTFKTHNITWYLITLSIINFWFFIPFIFTKELLYLIISIISCYFIFNSYWLAIMIGLIWWMIIFDIETIIRYKKSYKVIANIKKQ